MQQQREYISLRSLVDGCQTLNEVLFRFNQKYHGSGRYLFRGKSEIATCEVLTMRGEEENPEASGVVALPWGGVLWVRRLQSAAFTLGNLEYARLQEEERIKRTNAIVAISQEDALRREATQKEYRQRKAKMRHSFIRSSRRENRLHLMEKQF
jgi:hypothetical protein